MSAYLGPLAHERTWANEQYRYNEVCNSPT
jgi:hypothetical protein